VIQLNIVQALKNTKNDLLTFIVTNLNNKSDILHTHTALDVGSVSRTLIWQNQSGSLECVAQNLNLSNSLSDYDGIEIIFADNKMGAQSPIFNTGFIPYSDDVTYTELICSSGKRLVTVQLDDSGEIVIFADAYDMSGSTDNTISVPYKIYGIKGVIL
jgi:hypothetical protein